MYLSYVDCAEVVVEAVHKVCPIADEERPQYVELIEKALREDTLDKVRRCDMLNRGMVESAIGMPGMQRAMLQTCFPKTWQMIKDIEKESLPEGGWETIKEVSTEDK